MDPEPLDLLRVWMNSFHFRYHLNPSLKDGQGDQKTTDLQNISQDLVRVISPAQEAGHP